MAEYIEAEVVEGGAIETDGVIEGKVKPEQVGSGVPGYEAQTIYPESGCVFSRFEMAGFPEPTAEETITENGTHHVERVGVVKVKVPQGVFPAGTLPVSANGVYDVTEYAGVNVAVPIVFGMELLVLELLTVTVDEDFSGVLNGALGALYNLIPDDKKTGGTNTIGIVYASLVDTPETADQLMSWGGHYNAGARNVGRKWDGSKIVIQSNPAINSWTAKLKSGTRYRIAWMRFA